MKEPEKLDLSTNQFLKYLTNELRDLIHSKILNIDNAEEIILDKSIHKHSIFYDLNIEDNLNKTVNRIDMCDITYKFLIHDENTGILCLSGRLIRLEYIKYFIKMSMNEC